MRPFDPQLLVVAPAARRPVVALGIAGVLSGAATIGSAFAIAGLVVAVARGGSVLAPAMWVAALFLVRAVLAHVTERVAAWAGTRVATDLRSTLLRAWLERGADERPDRARASTLASQGCATVEPYVARYLPALITAAVVPAAVVVVLAVVDWVSALVVVLTVPLLPVFAALIGARTEADTQRRWRALSGLAGHFLDVVRGLPTLVVHGRAERQVATIERVSEKHRVATMRTLRLAFLSSAALELLATISVAIVAVSVGLRLTTGHMTLGVGLVAILLAPEAYWPIRRVGAEFHSAADGVQALQDVIAELGVSSGPASAPAGGADATGMPVLEARGLTYRYPGTERDVLHHLDVTTGPGLTVVTGPSGTGKTTLLEVLAGIRRPTAGTVAHPTTHLVSQRPFLGAGTIRDNVLLGAPEGTDDDAIGAALARVGLADVVAGLPAGLDTVLGDDGFGLSAGQRARLVLARALLSTAPAVLVDEPTAHLDPASAQLVHDVLADLARERAVVAVTHRAELVAHADRHVVLEPVGADR